ncbi:NF-X1-type zinc finger protein NFXL1 [Trichinella nativa]|uniref:NF-X1-type zinc finger protein NFXL1 n=1 Tax=Trichinella nativa TaxID=6335 RepID=A0A0V1LDH9_9BILA|nr:NF-X1-type zinc finger protein NFXL1 [Trichinella nativa]
MQKCHPGNCAPCSKVPFAENVKGELILKDGFLLHYMETKGIAHRCLKKCHPGPYPSCSQKFESYCLCKRSRKNFPCLLHVTCLSFSAWQCNRRCKLILDCGKHQCKKTCCTKLKPVFHSLHSSFGCRVHNCNWPCHPGRCYPCELELVYYSVEQSGVCGSEVFRQLDIFIMFYGFNEQLKFNWFYDYCKREQTAGCVTQQMYPSKSKYQKSITVRQGKQQKPTRLDPPRPDVPLTHQGHQVQCDWLA